MKDERLVLAVRVIHLRESDDVYAVAIFTKAPREGKFYDQAVLYTTNPDKAQAGPGGH